MHTQKQAHICVHTYILHMYTHIHTNMEMVDDTWEIIPEASSGLHSMHIHTEKKENKGKNEWEGEEGMMKEKNDNLSC